MLYCFCRVLGKGVMYYGHSKNTVKLLSHRERVDCIENASKPIDSFFSVMGLVTWLKVFNRLDTAVQRRVSASQHLSRNTCLPIGPVFFFSDRIYQHVLWEAT